MHFLQPLYLNDCLLSERGAGARASLARRAHARAGGASGRPAPAQPSADPQRAAAARGQPLHGGQASPSRPLQPELCGGWRPLCFDAQLFRLVHYGSSLLRLSLTSFSLALSATAVQKRQDILPGSFYSNNTCPLPLMAILPYCISVNEKYKLHFRSILRLLVW